MTITTTPDRGLKVSEAAERLACGEGSVYRLVAAGELAAFRVGRLLRIRESALAEFMRGTATATATDPGTIPAL